MFYYSLIGLACNYMFLQDLSLLINRKKIILFILLSCLRNSMVFGREEYLHPNAMTTGAVYNFKKPLISEIDFDLADQLESCSQGFALKLRLQCGLQHFNMNNPV